MPLLTPRRSLRPRLRSVAEHGRDTVKKTVKLRRKATPKKIEWIKTAKVRATYRKKAR